VTDDAQERAKVRIGTLLADKWNLERLLGVGGMAAVYAGRHRNGARGAIKILHPELARVPELRERFLREGYLANKVDHAGALKVLDDDVVKEGPDAGLAYLVMELLEGESIDAKMQRLQQTLPEDEVLAVADDVLATLDAAHDKGIVHRDIKPENLFLSKETDAEGRETTRTKILDFGLARMEMGAITRAGLALGTPSFMAPEQAAGKSEEIDGRTDLFAVGATMFRMLTGARIHDGANGAEIVSKMASLPAPSIRTVRAEISEDVAAIIDRALQFKREDRYPNSAAMREDVQKARAARAITQARTAIGNEPTLHDDSPTATAGPKSVSGSASASASKSPLPTETSLQDVLAPPKRWRAPVGFAVFWVIAVSAFATVFFVVRSHLAGPTSVETAAEQPAGSTSGSVDPSASVSGEPSPSTPIDPATSASEAPTPDEYLEDVDAGADAAPEDAAAPKIAATPKSTGTKKPVYVKPPPKKKKKWK
jgi:serine/threonine-protein kinase